MAIDGLLAERRTETAPGAAVIVVGDGVVLAKGAYGMADLERRIPIETDTAFRLASVSKQFTAMAIMMLEEEGRLLNQANSPALEAEVLSSEYFRANCSNPSCA